MLIIPLSDFLPNFIIIYLPNIIFIFFIIIFWILIEISLNRSYYTLRKKLGDKLGIQVSKLGIKAIVTILAIILILANIPGINENVLKIMGLIITGIIAFSSSTIIANGMSGILIKIIRPFKIGDLVKIDEYVGEVAEVRYFYVELETPKRELITIPNNFIMNRTVTNYSEAKYIVNVRLSLGYDVNRIKAEELLIKAAKKVGLVTPFVSITDLKDHSVTYEINGHIKGAKKLPIIESNLRKTILDEFHIAKIEILSPQYISHRPVKLDVVLPKLTKEIVKAIKKKENEEKGMVKKLEAELFQEAEKMVKKEKKLEREEEELAESEQKK